MRGKRRNKRRTLTGMLVLLMLTIGLIGFAILQQWNNNSLTGPGIADAATPTESAAPSEMISPPIKPTTPSVTEPTGSPNPPTKEEVPVPSPDPVDKDKYKGRKLVALTFDDGPDGKYTPQILDILKEYNAKATFFVVGPQVEKHADVAKRIIEEGHSIGNHTWSHSDLTKLSAYARNKEIAKTQQAIMDATGIKSHLVRAPYGAISDAVLKTIRNDKMRHVYWTVDTKDWAGSSVEEMHKNVLAHTRKGGIILMHSFGGRKHAIEHTVKLLPSIIKDLGAKGYEFVTVDELIESGQYHPSVIK